VTDEHRGGGEVRRTRLKSTCGTLNSADWVRQHVISGMAGILQVGLASNGHPLSTTYTPFSINGGVQMLPAAFKRLATHTQHL